MRVTLLAHASLLVEAGGFRLATDPWWWGPTYLHSWWHFPSPWLPADLVRTLDAVYITHEHVDHFHVPTLARIVAERPDLPIYVPRLFTSRFVDKLRALGLRDVREMAPGETITVGEGVRLTSWQSRADDSLLVVEADGATLLDLNDNLVAPELRRAIQRRHPRVDLLAKSYANAEAYPIVYETQGGDAPDWDNRRLLENFLEEVAAFAPRRFLPFASLFCFLDGKQRPLNRHLVTPDQLFALREQRGVESEGVDLQPGDAIDLPSGKVTRHAGPRVEWPARDRHLAALAAEHAGEVQRLAEEERRAKVALLPLLEPFLDGLWARLPWLVRRGLALRLRFVVPDAADGDGAGVVLRGGRFAVGRELCRDDWDARVEVPIWPLAEVLAGRETWASLLISCRLRVTLRAGARPRELAFWTVLLVDDLGYFHLGALGSRRGAAVAWGRRHELAAYALDLLRGRLLEKRMQGKFAQSRGAVDATRRAPDGR